MSADSGPLSSGDLKDASAAHQRRPRRLVRKVVLPVLTIAAIVAIIWWLEDRQSDAGTSDSGVPRGLIDLPLDPRSTGLNVGPEEGKMAPDFILESLDGGDFRLSDLRGKAVVINFWATWCQPCRKEMPNLIQAYQRYRDRGLVIVGVNLQEGRSIIEPFAGTSALTSRS